MQEMIEVLATVTRQKIHKSLQESPCFSLLIDETTDVAVLNQLIIFAQYLSPKSGKVTTSFLQVVDLPNGLAQTITTAVQDMLQSLSLPQTKFVGLGSDGANVMVGQHNGVAAKLRSTNKQLVNIHCIAHRLALAAAQSAEGIPYLLKFKSILGQLFRFYEYSSVRTSGLKAIQVSRN
ncbi:zinc finger protein 862-like [Patiria miniata]|uniref:DUF4371 domain-containing protein n=1 Tax=Patiria miniata TaxID=46514 RepID=A0A913ZTC7_PATMI|nr:zinc finger protein 862-like [Patiria miniata]